MQYLKGIHCPCDKIKQTILSMVVNTYTKKDGDEQYNRIVNTIKNEKQFTNVMIYNNIVSIRTGVYLEMDSEKNYDNAKTVFLNSHYCAELKQEDNELIQELQKYIDEESYMYFVIPIHEHIIELPPIKPITIDDVLNAASVGKVSKSDFINYLEERFHINHNHDVYDYFNNDKGCISRLHLDTVFEDVERGGKYGTMYNRIYWDNTLIGYYSRTGKYLDAYSYCTFDKNAWNEMINTMLEEIDFGVDECVEVVDRNADLFNHISIHGRGLEQYED